MLRIITSRSFLRDLKRCRKRGKEEAKLNHLLEILRLQQPIPAKYRDHALTGNWAGFRECHIEPDWLLIYYTTEEFLHLTRTGSHSDLF